MEPTSLSLGPVTWTSWDPSPLVVVPAVVALMLFARAFVRLRRRGRSDHAGGRRAALFVLAVALAVLPLVSPLDAAAQTSLSAHMLQHVLIGDAAPALALLALRGPLLFFALPVGLVRPFARSSALRRVLGFLLRPRVSLGLWAAVIAAWHVPAVYDYALTHQAAHDLEHVSFVAAGLLVWAQVIDPARRRALLPSQRLACALAMAAFALVLGGILFIAGPLYPYYARSGLALFGLSPYADQHLAGLVMLSEQLAALALCSSFLLTGPGRPGLARARRFAPVEPGQVVLLSDLSADATARGR